MHDEVLVSKTALAQHSEERPLWRGIEVEAVVDNRPPIPRSECASECRAAACNHLGFIMAFPKVLAKMTDFAELGFDSPPRIPSSLCELRQWIELLGVGR